MATDADARAARTLVTLGVLGESAVDQVLHTVDGGTWADALEGAGVQDERLIQALEVVRATASPLGSDVVTRGTPGRYVLGSALGVGGMGRVTLAADGHLHRQVAVKELLVQHPAMELRFLREARLTAQLEHPGIVPVYELGRHADGTLYYTMKEVRGHTLRDALDAARTTTERLALLGVLVDVCQAVGYAHSKGVVHRDLKPDNVMIGAFGETTVLDWGLAKSENEPDVSLPAGVAIGSGTGSDLTRAGTVMGTPKYMSPEQAEGRLADVDARSDVWAIGVMLYELLTGDVPFVGSSASVLEQVKQGVWVPPDSLVQGLPAPLVAVCMKALEKDPAERYHDAFQVAAELEAWRNGTAVGAHTYGAVERVRLAAGRFRLLWIGVAALAIGAAAGWLGRGPEVALHRSASEAAELDARFLERVASASQLGLQGNAGDALALARDALTWAPAGRAALAQGVIDAYAASGDVRVLTTAPSRAVAFTPSGTRVAWVEGTAVHVFDPVSGSLLGQVDVAGEVAAFAFTPDEGQLWVVLADGTATARSLVDLSEKARFPVGPAPVGTVLATGTEVLVGTPGSWRRWSRTGEPLPLPPELARAPWLVVRDKAVVEERRALERRDGLVVHRADGPDLRLPDVDGPVALGAHDLAVGGPFGALLRRLDTTDSTLPVVRPLAVGWRPTELAIDPRSKLLAAAGTQGVALWSISPSEGPTSNLRVCADGRVVPVLPFPPLAARVPPDRACR